MSHSIVFLLASLCWEGRALCAEMRASELAIEIRGIISSSDPRACVALLQDIDQGKLIAVKLGYMVFGQAKVINIKAKTIILERDNQLEYLGAKPIAEPPTTKEFQ